MTPKLKSLVVQARARIIWGESQDAVKNSLIEAGLPPDTAQLIVDKATEEYAREVRRIGLRNFVFGTASILGGGALSGFASHYGRIFREHSMVQDRIHAAGIVVIGYGIWLLAKGIYRIILGGRARESIPDIES
ncbi:MAG: hypothetical protein M5U15_06030 [Kiritimatiellae bacterium]|nr:hypothetical protein [Kiritimatiellia bacterium]